MSESHFFCLHRSRRGGSKWVCNLVDPQSGRGQSLPPFLSSSWGRSRIFFVYTGKGSPQAGIFHCCGKKNAPPDGSSGVHFWAPRIQAGGGGRPSGWPAHRRGAQGRRCRSPDRAGTHILPARSSQWVRIGEAASCAARPPAGCLKSIAGRSPKTLCFSMVCYTALVRQLIILRYFKVFVVTPN